MRYYGDSPWLKVRVAGSLVQLKRPAGSQIATLADRVPHVMRATRIAAEVRPEDAAQLKVSVPAEEIVEVCALLAALTLSVEGLDWSALDEAARVRCWDEQGASQVFRTFGLVFGAHLVPAAVEAINATCEPPPAAPAPKRSRSKKSV